MENKILEKLRKLMLKKESAEGMGSLEEAAVFAAGIQKMLNQYNLSLDDIDTSDRSSKIQKERGIDGKSKGFKGRSGYLIMYVIAKHNWCRVYSSGDVKNPRITIIGSPENIEVCKYLYSVIMDAADKIGKKEYRNYINGLTSTITEAVYGVKKPSRGKYMRSFLAGFKRGLNAKFTAEREAFRKEYEKADALIVSNDKMLAAFEEAAWPNMKTFSTKISDTGDAKEKGYESGKNLEITKGIFSTSNPIEILQLGESKHKCCVCKQEKPDSLMEKRVDKFACCDKWSPRKKQVLSV